MPQIRIPRLLHRIEVQIDNSVKVLCNDFCYFDELLEVERGLTLLVGVNELRKGNRGEVADCDLFG
jgi:hypothetical protein